MSSPSERQLTYGQAIREATGQEMARDANVFVLGLGITDPKGIFGTTLDLHKEFGPSRSVETPLSEDAMTGVAIGAALAGMRPIHVHQRMDFLLLAMNQLVNIAAKTRYMFGGAFSVPMVVRAVIGRSWGQGAQHSQALHAFFMHTPGIKVVAPATPFHAKGCLIAAIRDNDPVLMVEHRMLHNLRGIVPEEPFTIPFGQAQILIPGEDVTIVAISHMAVEAVRAHHLLARVGIRAEVIDPVCLSPLDVKTIVASVARTGHLLVVDNGWLAAGASAEIIAVVAERMTARFARMGCAATPCPTTRPLEDLFYPSAKTIAERVYFMLRGKDDWTPPKVEAPELVEFRGPF